MQIKRPQRDKGTSETKDSDHEGGGVEARLPQCWTPKAHIVGVILNGIRRETSHVGGSMHESVPE